MKTIIFDFNRTLYDPEKAQLVPGAVLVLQELHARGCKLFLVSRKENNRGDLIQETGVGNYFAAIALLGEKTPEAMAAFMERNKLEAKSAVMVGDRVREEIMVGNMLGMQTVWFQNGKFANELPILEKEQPTHRIAKLEELLSIIL